MGNLSTKPMAYKTKENGEIVKMERINSNYSVVHFKSGPERAKEYELRKEYDCLGTWAEYENGLTEVAND